MHAGLRITVFQLYRWSTHWFQLVIDIPEEWRGDEVHLRWNSGSEAMVHNIFSCASVDMYDVEVVTNFEIRFFQNLALILSLTMFII